MVKNEARCPHCDTELESIPSKKRKCPTCKDTIYRFKDRHTGDVFLGAEEEIAAQKKAAKEDMLYKEHRENLAKFGLSDAELDTLVSQSGSNLPLDVIWMGYNELVSKTLSKQYLTADDWGFLELVYMRQAELLADEGKSNFRLQRSVFQARVMELVTGQAERARMVGDVESASIDLDAKVELMAHERRSCEAAQKLHGRAFTAKDAMDRYALPLDGCDRRKCACRWMPKGYLKSIEKYQ